MVREIGERLRFLDSVGIGYLSLERSATTLSGGEAQRIRLATQIGSSLVGVLYILDEPSIGLHQRDNEKLIGTLERLRDIGNTVIVVEHDEGTIRAADHVVDLGPGAGEHGGEVVAEGTAEEIQRQPGSLTGQFLSGEREIAVPEHRRTPRGELVVRGAREHNLKGIDVSFPLGVLDRGHRRFGLGQVDPRQRDPLPLRRQPPAPRAAAARRARPNRRHRAGRQDHQHRPVADRAHAAFEPGHLHGNLRPHPPALLSTREARARGYKPGRFSFNVKGGRCEVCRGDGQIKIEMHFLPDVYVPCEQCHGAPLQPRDAGGPLQGQVDRRRARDVGRRGGRVLRADPEDRRRLRTLHDVGLDYIRLGQPATQLSGGEAQRVKLATELSKVATGDTLYILDEPTTGLHFADVERLLEVLDRLVEQGNTVVVIEHNLDVIKTADHIIDLGPEGGDAGGELIATGTPEQVAGSPTSYTGRFLARPGRTVRAGAEAAAHEAQARAGRGLGAQALSESPGLRSEHRGVAARRRGMLSSAAARCAALDLHARARGSRRSSSAMRARCSSSGRRPPRK